MSETRELTILDTYLRNAVEFHHNEAIKLALMTDDLKRLPVVLKERDELIASLQAELEGFKNGGIE